MKAANIAVPALVGILIVYALIKKVNVYKAFVDGAAEAVPQLIAILPFLAAMLGAISLLRASGAVECFTGVMRPVTDRLGISPALVPLIALRPFSGSASLAMLKDILTEFGADSRVGRAASVLVGSTETVFYTTAVYFGAVGVTKTRHAIPAALISGAVGAAVGLLLVR